MHDDDVPNCGNKSLITRSGNDMLMTSSWEIYESGELKRILYLLPRQVRQKYDYWKVQIWEYGPGAVRVHRFPGFKDHALRGKWKGYRSSYLNRQYRVIYRIEDKEMKVKVKRIGPHDY